MDFDDYCNACWTEEDKLTIKECYEELPARLKGKLTNALYAFYLPFENLTLNESEGEE